MSSRRTISNTFTVTTMDDPVSVQAQYSPDKTVVHTVWQAGDLYMRTRESDSSAWSSWHKIVGESGGETDYQFALSANLVTQDGTSATAPSDISSSAWQDAPMATTTQKPYLWSKVQKKDGNGNNVGSATYIRLTGEEGKDGLSPNPNILLRTVFDRGIDKVSEKWSFDSSYVSIDTTSDTVVEGRKSIRLNSQNNVNGVVFSQSVLGKIKPNTWYTASFNAFHAPGGDFVMSFNNLIGGSRHLIYDGNVIVDGVARTIVADSCNVVINADWGGARHTVTFKTRSSEHISTTRLEFVFWQGYSSTSNPPHSQTAICMPKLELGENATTYIANEDDLVGNEGQSIRGKIGRAYYYAGEWDELADSFTVVVNDAQAPFFGYKPSGSTHGYYVLVRDLNGTFTKSQIYTDCGNPVAQSANWSKMADDQEYIITKAIFGSYAHFGSAIINGDWMISQYGIINGTESQNYSSFNPQHPNDDIGNNFIPKYAINLLTGETIQNSEITRFKNINNDFVYNATGTARIVGWCYTINEYNNVQATGQYKNTSEHPAGMRIIMPYNTKFIGRRVVVYDDSLPPFTSGLNLGLEIYLEDDSANAAFRGVFTNMNDPSFFHNAQKVTSISFISGHVELLGVPSQDGQKCEWMLVNINAGWHSFY